MTTIQAAAKTLLRKHPNRQITAAIDYDPYWWLFEAPLKDEDDFDAPYYVVSKKSGVIRTYLPTADLDNFDDAYANRRIKL